MRPEFFLAVSLRDDVEQSNRAVQIIVPLRLDRLLPRKRCVAILLQAKADNKDNYCCHKNIISYMNNLKLNTKLNLVQFLSALAASPNCT